MILSERDIQTLVRAGLSYAQARTYLVLVIIGRTSTKVIAQLARTDAANTYRAVVGLQNLSLVNKIIAKPNLYEAIPIKEGIALLNERRKDEFVEVTQLTTLLGEKFETPICDQPQMSKDQFLIVSPRTSYINASIKNYQNAKHSIDIISTQKRSAQSADIYADAEKKALERGVKLRSIIENPTNKIVQNRPEPEGKRLSNKQRRYITEVPKVVGAIFDNEVATFLIKPDASYMESPCLLTNHAGFILMFRNYFDKLWESAIPF
ncbi:MAG: TrmB family transcriptional regulator [Candidatus Bathyarchaeia archaeon]|jgi:sugar-specific transcriptional regulator TrmB